MRNFLQLLIFIIFLQLLTACNRKEKITLVAEQGSPQEKYAAQKLAEALDQYGYEVNLSENLPSGKENAVVTGLRSGAYSSLFLLAGLQTDSLGREGFILQSRGRTTFVTGSDPNGVLYGCLELIERLKKQGKVPNKIEVSESPEMVMRGTCIGLQKTEYLPGRNVYEYPITQENFPWFYNKELWIQYLDMLVENRYNSLYLWNGHPFASLVKLRDYPYAVEVDEDTFRKNEEMYTFLTEERYRYRVCRMSRRG